VDLVCQWEGGEYGERVKESEYSANTIYKYVNEKMRPETIPVMRGGGINENDVGV
jgi:hypothetical protein